MTELKIVHSEYVEDVLAKYDSRVGKQMWVSPLVHIGTIVNDNGETLEKILPTSSKEIQDEINRILEDVPKAIQAINEFKAYLESNPDVLQTIQAIEENKVDKVEGYGLSKNNFTDELLTKLNKIEDKANKVEIVNNLEETLSGKALDAYQGYVLSQSLASVFQNVDSGKGLVANAIIDKGGSGVSNDSTFQELANGVINIESGGELDANLVNYSGEFGFNGDLTIPSEIDGISVTSIGDKAFADCTGLTSVTIPDSVTSIGISAFYHCSNLISVTIPDSVTSIGISAFHYCSNLISVTIPDSVTSIGISAFHYCSNLISVTIPDGVTSIGEFTFGHCNSLTNVTIPNSVTSIGNYAFYYCNSLTNVTIPNSVTSIGDIAFSYCEGLTSITIPNSVTSIGDYAFADCSNLATAYVPKGLTYPSNAFPTETNIITYTPGGADDPTIGGNK